MTLLSRFSKCAAATAIAILCLTASAEADTSVDRIISAGKVVIAVQNDAPPYSQVGADNQPEGLDIDVAKQIATDLGVELELVVVTGQNRIPSLLSGRADIVVATVGINPQRAAAVAISDPYTSFPMAVIGAADKPLAELSDLKNYAVGVTRGSFQDDVMSRKLPDLEANRYDDDAVTIQSLVSGQVDFTAFGMATLEDLQRRFPEMNLEAKLELAPVIAGIAVKREDADLLRWINTWIQFHNASGFLDQAHSKWSAGRAQ